MSSDLVKHTAEIVEAYVSNNEVPSKEVPTLLNSVFHALQRLSVGETETSQPIDYGSYNTSGTRTPPTKSEKKRPVPAVSPEESVREDSITCMICAKPCKALKGHLTRSHSIDFDQYRKMFDLPKDFPMVAPSYSAKRRQLALDAGLGEKLRESRKRAKEIVES